FVIILGTAATGIIKFGPELQSNIDVDNSDFVLFGNKYTFADNNSAAFPAGGSIRVVNDRGDVKLTVSPDDHVHVVSNYVVISGNQNDANNIRGARVPTFSTEGSILVLSSTGNKGVDNAEKARVNIEVQVPRKAAAD